MPQWTAETLMFFFITALSLLAAVLYRALSWASPARLEELNEEYRRYPELPDMEGAIVVAGGLKLALYASLVLLIGGHCIDDDGISARAYAAAAAVSIAVMLCMEAIALVAAGYHSGRALYRCMPLVAAFSAVGGVLLDAGDAAAGVLARILGRQAPPPHDEAAEDDILDAVSEGEREGVLEDQERSMIESIIESRDAVVSEIMTPRTALTIVTEEMTMRAAMDVAVESGHSRLPVAAETADNIVGVLHVKDLLHHLSRDGDFSLPVRTIMRAPHFVPETKQVRELLQEFRGTSIHMAIVLDEYGGTSGIVTIEDILEEIVGEIEDEYDEYQPPEIRVLSPGRIVAAARATVGDVNDALGTDISEEEEYDTIAGFVLYHTGRIPGVGEVLEIGSLRVRILEADERRIKRLAVEVMRAPGTESPGG